MNLKDRWFLTYQGPAAIAFWDCLEKHYSQPHRHYHTLSHLQHSFLELDNLSLSSEDKQTISLAIWFHDIVYDTQASNNEEQSTVLFREAARQLQLSVGLTNQVSDYILQTKYINCIVNSSILCDLFLDIDLSILGQDSKVYQEYTQQIRQEYSWVPQEIYNVKRAEVLKRIMSWKSIYRSTHFGMKYEVQAKINLSTEIATLIRN
jgi:predicted metal-dependent HD superfamily phosphohydrolase